MSDFDGEAMFLNAVCDDADDDVSYSYHQRRHLRLLRFSACNSEFHLSTVLVMHKRSTLLELEDDAILAAELPCK